MFGLPAGSRAKRWPVRRKRTIWCWLFLLALPACGDPFERLLGPVPEVPGVALLVDQRVGPLQAASAFDILGGRVARVDQTSAWDFLFFITEGGEPQLRPFGAVTGQPSDAGLQKVASSFEGLRVAPEEGYERMAPLSIAEGDVLAGVSRRDPTLQAIRCRRFAKLEILEIDLAGGRLRFRHLINPNCELRGLVPGKTGSQES